MTRATDSWPALSFLESLRPAPDEVVELALLAAYSADIGSIGATLLALAGRDNDRGRGGPSDFADAVEQLRGKVRIVIQRGRLARMRRTPRIAAVLDQFVREVDFDEATQSWHPKAALVRFRKTDGAVGWRLWIGSRNLTECVNRDIGLLLVSGEGGARIAGAGELARALGERAELAQVPPTRLALRVSKLLWHAPPGIRVERILWSSGDGRGSVPLPPDGADEIVIVSPFIDKSFLARQVTKARAPAQRVLLTTMREIERVGPSLAAFNDLLVLDAPEFPIRDVPDDEPLPDDGDQRDEEEEIGRGLHAKLLFTRAGGKRTLWLGSANATMRAWDGRNAEVNAELSVTDAVEKGLKALLGSARLVTAPAKEYAELPADLEEEALERARAQVAVRWAATLKVESESACLVQRDGRPSDGPHPDNLRIKLEVGSLFGELREWQRGKGKVELGPMLLAEQSELVRVRVSGAGGALSWLQRAPADPPFDVERDRAAFIRLLGARGFLLWLARLLADDSGSGEEDWTIERPQERFDHSAVPTLDLDLPTLEEILAAWSRDRDRFREIERRVSDYLPAVRDHARREEPKIAELISSFEDLWTKLRIGLDNEPRGRRR
jgi:hypothetical protein